MMYFMQFPPEIRNSIYEFLVVKETSVPICSPRRKHKVNKELTSESFSVLLHLNKQINIEASSIFYSRNCFLLGNGSYGSTGDPNVHGMKAFLDRVPRRCLALITTVVVEIHGRQPYQGWVPLLAGLKLELGTLDDAASLHTISRALCTRFQGLEYVQYRLTEGPKLCVQPACPETKRLTRAETKMHLEKTFKILMKSKSIKGLSTSGTAGTLIDMRAVVADLASRDVTLATRISSWPPPESCPKASFFK